MPTLVCDPPPQHITTEQASSIAADVSARVAVFKGEVNGSSDKSSSYVALAPSQDIVNMTWQLHELCKLALQGVISPVQYCTTARTVVLRSMGLDLDQEVARAECEANPNVRPSELGAAAPAPSGTTARDGAPMTPGCALLREVDRVTTRGKSVLPEDTLLLWDRAAGSGYVGVLRSDAIRMSDRGDLEIETDPGRLYEMQVNPKPYLVPTDVEVSGWRAVWDHDVGPALVDAAGRVVDIEKSLGTGEDLDRAYLIPASTPFLVALDLGDRNVVNVRSFTVDPACLPR